MSRWIQAIQSRLFKPALPVPEPGLYHYLRQDSQAKTRVHLRLDPDGQGLLVVNASRVIHLNPTAAVMAYYHLEKLDSNQTVAAIRRKFKVSARQAQQDFASISGQLEELLKPDGACPVCELNLETTLPFQARPSAPYRMDLALTYRCNNQCAHCYNARERTFPEMNSQEWKTIIDRLWDLAIPHVVFTGGEPTAYQALPELVAYAEKKGLITGLNTNGRSLAEPAFLNRLVEAGLDHVQVTLESHRPDIHDRLVQAPGAWAQTVQGIKNALNSRLFVMTNTTLLRENSAFLAETLQFLADSGVPTVGLNGLIYSGRGASVGSGLDEGELPALLDLARQHCDTHQQKLIWYTPTQYCRFDPVAFDLGVKGCTAALYNMCVEPDGSVIPCQSYYHSLGNLLTQPWAQIWNHPLAVKLRERQEIPQKCRGCPTLQECGGGCPLAFEPASTRSHPSF